MTHDEATGGLAPECRVCPLCMGLAMLRHSRPEALEHLLKAGAELLLAARAVLDAADGLRGSATLQRIDIG
jgi:hypothetical protein